MRRLTLHTSALNDAEFDLYTSSLDDLVESPTDGPNKSMDDAYYEHLNVGIREARAWLRGRYSHISLSEIDSVSVASPFWTRPDRLMMSVLWSCIDPQAFSSKLRSIRLINRWSIFRGFKAGRTCRERRMRRSKLSIRARCVLCV